MSIFIKGLNVPDKYPVKVIINPTGEAFVDYGPYFETLEAVNVPAPHGRLIDADDLMHEFAKFVRASNNSDFAPVPTWNDAVSLLGSAPTIIEAEENNHE